MKGEKALMEQVYYTEENENERLGGKKGERH